MFSPLFLIPPQRKVPWAATTPTGYRLLGVWEVIFNYTVGQCPRKTYIYIGIIYLRNHIIKRHLGEKKTGERVILVYYPESL